MPLTNGQKREYQKEYMRRKRSNKTEDVRPDLLDPNVRPLSLYSPSKFLSYEEDLKVQQNVVNTLKVMSGSRRQQFEGLTNTFIPNKYRTDADISNLKVLTYTREGDATK